MSDSEFELEFSDDESAKQDAIEAAHIKLKEDEGLVKDAQELARVQEERRFQSIQTSCTRYLYYQRLEQMNTFALGLLREQLGLLRISVDSLMGTFDLGCQVKLEELIKFMPNAQLDRSKSNIANVQLQNPSVNVGISANGHATIMGAKSTSELYLAARRTTCIVSKHINPNAKVINLQVRNLVMHLVFPESIDLAVMQSALKRADVDCHRPAGFACLQVTFSPKDLPLVQPEPPEISMVGAPESQYHSSGGGHSTLTGGYSNQYFAASQQNHQNQTAKAEGHGQSQGQQMVQTNASAPAPGQGDVKAEVTTTSFADPSSPPKAEGDQQQDQQIASVTNMDDKDHQPRDQQQHEYDQRYQREQQEQQQQQPQQYQFNHPMETPYPTEFHFAFSAKIFGNGKIMIMGLKGLSMGVMASRIMFQLVQKYNKKHAYTETVRFGQLVSRNVNIEQAAARAAAQAAERSGRASRASNSNASATAAASAAAGGSGGGTPVKRQRTMASQRQQRTTASRGSQYGAGGYGLGDGDDDDDDDWGNDGDIGFG